MSILQAIGIVFLSLVAMLGVVGGIAYLVTADISANGRADRELIAQQYAEMWDDHDYASVEHHLDQPRQGYPVPFAD